MLADSPGQQHEEPLDRRRVFFALQPDAELREHLAECVREAHRRVGGRPVPGANLHITLAFLGTLGSSELAAVRDVGGQVAMPVVEMVLDRIGFWARGGLVWAGCRKPPGQLVDFVDRLRLALARRGFAGEKRAYEPHVTLLRSARRRPRMRLDLLRWPVTEFFLMESSLGPDGPRYSSLRRWSARQDME